MWQMDCWNIESRKRVYNRNGNESISLQRERERQMKIICGKLSSSVGQDVEKIICSKTSTSAEPINITIFLIL